MPCRSSRGGAFVITDIARDGMLQGPDVHGLAAAAAATRCRSSPAAGSRRWEDVSRLAAVSGIGGVITGKALYEGRFTVAQAVETFAQPPVPR